MRVVFPSNTLLLSTSVDRILDQTNRVSNPWECGLSDHNNLACLVSMLVALLSKAGLSTIPISRVPVIIITTATPGSLISVFAMAILARLASIIMSMIGQTINGFGCLARVLVIIQRILGCQVT
jgi:hypothetical protein